MKRLLLFLIWFSFGFLYAQETAYFYITEGNDDAYEIEDVGVYLDMEYLELTYSYDLHIVGLRFQNVNIPPGAEIVSAFVQLTSFEANDCPNFVHVVCEKSINPSPFIPVVDNIKDRSHTSYFVNWDVPVWSTPFIPGPDQRTPEMNGAIQEIIDMQGWTSGNPIVFILSGMYATCSNKACSWEYMGDMYAPVLQITFHDYASVNEQSLDHKMNVFPNPVSDKFALSFTELTEGEYDISLFDLQGKQLHQIHDGWLSQGDHHFELSVADMNILQGIYLLSISGNKHVVNRKIIVH